MLNQHEWVKKCLEKYHREKLPSGETWELAHYPTPLCLGGTETILLWSRDHTVQGVLQSEEFDHPCVCWKASDSDRRNIEVFYPEYLSLLEKWFFELRSRAGKIGAKVTAERGGGWRNLSLEERRELGRKAGLCVSHETQVKGGKIAGRKTFDEKTGVHGRTHEQIRKDGRKGALKNIEERTGRYSPENLSKGGKLGGKATSSRRFKCLETGHISTPAGLANYQRARNIDTNLRIEILNHEG